MLSVHRHYRSWNDKANEWRAGRWVQDLLSLNQLTSSSLLCVLLGEKWRFTGYGLHGIWNSSVMYKSCALNRSLHCDRKVHPVVSYGKVLTHAKIQTYNSTNYIINISLWIYIKYGTYYVDHTAEWGPEIVKRKGGLSSLLLLILILHNPLDQHSHNALLQSVPHWHKSTTN